MFVHDNQVYVTSSRLRQCLQLCLCENCPSGAANDSLAGQFGHAHAQSATHSPVGIQDTHVLVAALKTSFVSSTALSGRTYPALQGFQAQQSSPFVPVTLYRVCQLGSDVTKFTLACLRGLDPSSLALAWSPLHTSMDGWVAAACIYLYHHVMLCYDHSIVQLMCVAMQALIWDRAERISEAWPAAPPPKQPLPVWCFMPMLRNPLVLDLNGRPP